MLVLGVSVGVGGASVLSAQVPPSSSSEEPGSTAGVPDSGAVELSPFVVNSESDVGYVASNSLAGSRLNTPLKDTAASISVLTPEFLQDIGATSLEDALRWSTNSQLQMQDTLAFSNKNDDTNSTFGTFGEFRVRGLPATKTRNYFKWRLPIDSYNIERVEEARGPNSILFGIGDAGGVVNVGTKQAHFGRDRRSATAQISSHGGYRGTVDLNQEVSSQLALRFNAVYNHEESFRLFSFNQNKAADLAATFKLFPTTTIRAEVEGGKLKQIIGSNLALVDEFSNWVAAGRPIRNFVTPATGTPAITYIGNSKSLMNLAAQWHGGGGTDIPLLPPEGDYSVNAGGPGGNLRTGRFNTESLILDQQIGRNTFLQLGYNRQNDHTRSFMPAKDSAAGRLYADGNAFFPDGTPNPYVGQYFIEGQTWIWDKARRSTNYRGTLATDLDFGKWGRYRLAGLLEREERRDADHALIEVWDGAPFNPNPENAANVVWRRNYVTEGNWSTYYRSMPTHEGLVSNLTDPVTGSTLSSTYVSRNAGGVTDNPEDQDTQQLVLQAHYFDDRLIFGVGKRWDQLEVLNRSSKRDPETNQYVVDYDSGVESDYSGNTRTFSVVGHLTDWFSVFYNNSDTFGLPPDVRILPDSQRASNPTSTGEDIGMAFTLLENKLYARLSYYKTDLKNGANFSYGGTYTNPSSISDIILDTLVNNGYMTEAETTQYRSNSTGATYNQKVEGYELNLVANPTRDWRIQVNLSYTDGATSNIAPEVKQWVQDVLPFYTSLPADVQQWVTGSRDNFTIEQVIAEFMDNHTQTLAGEGLILPGNRKFKANFFTAYNFSEGPLKGLSVGGGYIYQSELPAGFNSNGVLRYSNSYKDSNLMIGYRFGDVPWVENLRLQLNVQNVFNIEDPFVYRYFEDTDTPYRIRVREPRTWRLTASFDF